MNMTRFSKIINQYKKDFPALIEEEKFKWEAIKHFQEHWDIQAENFGEMLKEAFSKTYNLLTSHYYYPLGVIVNDFVIQDAERTRSMFIKLYDESRDLGTRVDELISSSEQLKSEIAYLEGKNHYQAANSISIYLWLKYPDKYFIYKFSEFKATIDMLDMEKTKGGTQVDKLIDSYEKLNEIREQLTKDSELKQLLDEHKTDSMYHDEKFGYVDSRFDSLH